ncbi:MAG TPA: 2-amino-4-hydroxy-6-hydroxymethyldihydropteridine diphosphokinase [Acidimicrobiia bacterium]|nr:2-amino-4-hydroxy-6-hydroxymethyldihydropteridine diphosphokinase [Acidimicrobiia bacterium]
MTYRAAVALGSNLGDRLAALRYAVAQLSDLGKISSVSSIYETAPVGGPEQGAFLNAVVALDTEMAALPLLDELNRIEAVAGRVREERWGPRTLDLDLIAMRDEDGNWQEMNTERLILPHPRAHRRRFVSEPLAEIWPVAEVADGMSAVDALELLDDQEVDLLAEEWLDDGMGTARRLVGLQMVLFVVYGVVIAKTGRIPATVDPAIVVGGLAAVVGAGVAIWAAATLGPALSPYPEPRSGSALVVSGPYRALRHPIYAGLVLLFIGAALLAGSVVGLGVAAGIGVFFWFKARYEETRLRMSVPGYARYQRRVRGRLFPLGGASP